MLNLNNPVRYSIAEQQHVTSILKPMGSQGWDDQKKATKNLKNKISTHTLTEQKCRCAYCESLLVKGASDIEHIADKGTYGEFCYEPCNLVTACTSCNSPSNKGTKDTIVHPENRSNYTMNQFTIVHPYLDNPDDHIKYQDKKRIMFDLPNCTQKGLETIKVFNWDQHWAYLARAINAETRNLTINVLQMVSEIATYKP